MKMRNLRGHFGQGNTINSQRHQPATNLRLTLHQPGHTQACSHCPILPLQYEDPVSTCVSDRSTNISISGSDSLSVLRYSRYKPNLASFWGSVIGPPTPSTQHHRGAPFSAWRGAFGATTGDIPIGSICWVRTYHTGQVDCIRAQASQ